MIQGFPIESIPPLGWAIIAIVGVVFFAWLFAEDRGNNGGPLYSIVETEDPRFSQVVNNDTGETAFVGTPEQCKTWIARAEQ